LDLKGSGLSFIYNLKGQGAENEIQESMILMSINNIREYKLTFKKKFEIQFALKLGEDPDRYFRMEHKNTQSYIAEHNLIKVLSLNSEEPEDRDLEVEGQNFDYYQNKFLKNLSRHIQAGVDSFEKAIQFNTSLIKLKRPRKAPKKFKFDKDFRDMQKHCKLLDPILANKLRKRAK
jgi:hypothetical protein